MNLTRVVMPTLPSDLNIFITADGSPTLCFSRADGYVEKMHHSAGALSESIYIYHSVVADAVARGWPARVLSFGLGLGYNELLAIAEFAKRGVQDWKVYSFEAHPFLREEFCRWATDGAGGLAEILEQVLRQVSDRLEMDREHLRTLIRSGLRDERLELRGAFPEAAPGAAGCSVVFYDAFSNKMESSPWSETTLQSELGPRLAQKCLFTTYAATGSLNRGLKALGFRLMNRAGFEGKRESTLAIRE
jgi:tRNA U34 5-methylaminomethyl-2-thiouridine-forming methyltransferase MnmC